MMNLRACETKVTAAPRAVRPPRSLWRCSTSRRRSRLIEDSGAPEGAASEVVITAGVKHVASRWFHRPRACAGRDSPRKRAVAPALGQPRLSGAGERLHEPAYQSHPRI